MATNAPSKSDTAKRDTTARNKARRFAAHQRKHPKDTTVFGQNTFKR